MLTDQMERLYTAHRIIEAGTLELADPGTERIAYVQWVPPTSGGHFRTRHHPLTTVTLVPLFAIDRAFGWERGSRVGTSRSLAGSRGGEPGIGSGGTDRNGLRGFAGRRRYGDNRDRPRMACLVHRSFRWTRTLARPLRGHGYGGRGLPWPLSASSGGGPGRFECSPAVDSPNRRASGGLQRRRVDPIDARAPDGPPSLGRAALAGALAGSLSVVYLWNHLYHENWLAGGYGLYPAQNSLAAVWLGKGLWAHARILIPQLAVVIVVIAVGRPRGMPTAVWAYPAVALSVLFVFFSAFSHPEPARRLAPAFMPWVPAVALAWSRWPDRYGRPPPHRSRLACPRPPSLHGFRRPLSRRPGRVYLPRRVLGGLDHRRSSRRAMVRSGTPRPSCDRRWRCPVAGTDPIGEPSSDLVTCKRGFESVRLLGYGPLACGRHSPRIRLGPLRLVALGAALLTTFCSGGEAPIRPSIELSEVVPTELLDEANKGRRVLEPDGSFVIPSRRTATSRGHMRQETVDSCRMGTAPAVMTVPRFGASSARSRVWFRASRSHEW